MILINAIGVFFFLKKINLKGKAKKEVYNNLVILNEVK